MTRIEAEQSAYVKTRNQESGFNWVAKPDPNGGWQVVPFNIHLNKRVAR
jgi:hypothetical protein